MSNLAYKDNLIRNLIHYLHLLHIIMLETSEDDDASISNMNYYSLL
jgi:hypothetical protein